MVESGIEKALGGSGYNSWTHPDQMIIEMQSRYIFDLKFSGKAI